MTKNALIGVLVAALVVVLVYFGYRRDANPLVTVPDDAFATSTPGSTSTPSTPGSTGSGSTSGTQQTSRAPSAVSGTGVISSNSTAILSGKVTPNGASTDYWYEYGTAVSLGSKTSAQTVGSGFVALNAPGHVTGLKANTKYYFRLVAQNRHGVSRGAVYTFQTNTNPPAQGSVPTAQTIGASSVARTSAQLNARVNPQGLATNYWFEFGETNSLGSLTGVASAGNSSATGAVSSDLSDLKPLTKYYYRVRAQNQFGTVSGTILSFTTAGPAASSQPEVRTNAASNIEENSATLNGRVDPNGSDTRYWFEYSRDEQLGKVIGTATTEQVMGGDEAPIGVKFDLSGLSSNTRYYYRLVAKNANGTVYGGVLSFRTDR